MKTPVKTIVSLLALIVLAGLAVADDNTHVSNQSSQGLNAIVSCNACDNPFPPCVFDDYQGQIQDCAYGGSGHGAGSIYIELWLDGAGAELHNHVEVEFDRSIVAYDNPLAGVDIYNVVYGTLSVPEGLPVITLFDN